jgi:peroxiredoxin Q/BCP
MSLRSMRPLLLCIPTISLGALLAAASPAAVAAQDSTGRGPSVVLASGPREGDRAPDFSLPWASADSVGGESWFSLSALRGRVVVLAFYPKDFTADCTAEMRTFTEQYAGLFGEDVVVVGINADSLETHVRFARSLGLPFRLLTDRDQAVSRRYGSAGSQGYNRRTVYVIDRRGQVAYSELRFNALSPGAYKDLEAAVQATRRRS